MLDAALFKASDCLGWKDPAGAEGPPLGPGVGSREGPVLLEAALSPIGHLLASESLGALRPRLLV